MSTTITVRGIDPADKSWLKREADQAGVSMEEFIRRMIHETRRKEAHRVKISEGFRRYFGPEHGVDLPPPARVGYRPVVFSDETKE